MIYKNKNTLIGAAVWLYEYTNIVYMRGLNACVSNSARIS